METRNSFLSLTVVLEFRCLVSADLLDTQEGEENICVGIHANNTH